MKISLSVLSGYVMCLILASCTSTSYETNESINNVQIEHLKNEVIRTEKAFEDMVAKEGITKAFLSFAAPNAVINRNDSLISGLKNIEHYFTVNGSRDDILLTWIPDYVDVSVSGDMAYTFGRYSFSFNDSDKKPKVGVFHTVWKRQPNGVWKFVWD